MNIICLTKTDLVSSTQLDDENLELPDYNLFRSEYRSSNKQEENFLYYEIRHVFWQDCICFEIMIGEKRCIFFLFSTGHQVRIRSFLILIFIILN